MTSHQHDPGQHQGEDLAALLDRLLDQVPDRTQKDLAIEAGISYPTLNAWINRTRGTSRVASDTLRALVGAFRRWGVEVTVAEMLRASGRPVPGPSDQEREERLLRLYRQLPEAKQRDLVRVGEVMLKDAQVTVRADRAS